MVPKIITDETVVRKPKILHISADFPDHTRVNGKTKAVDLLVRRTGAFDHVVFSMNRVSRMSDVGWREEKGIFTVNYFGLALGLRMKYFLTVLARRIETLISLRDIDFDVIHAHKLSFEGVVANWLSYRFKKPMVCSVRGSTDTMVLRFKPHYRPMYRRILKTAEKIFYVSPWAKPITEEYLGWDSSSKSRLLPNIIESTRLKCHGSIKLSKRFVCVFHLEYHKIKNIKNILKALDRISKDADHVGLDIIGGGRKRDFSKIAALIKGAESREMIRLVGHVDNIDVQKKMCEYIALLQPSYPETFGMTYFEALFAGISVMHARGTGIEGYFDKVDFVVGVDHRSIDEIARGMLYLYRNQLRLKEQIRKMHMSGFFDRFQAESIINGYTQEMLEVMRGAL